MGICEEIVQLQMNKCLKIATSEEKIVNAPSRQPLWDSN